MSKQVDRGVIEFLGPHGLTNTFYNFAQKISKFDTGIITTYALYITIALLFFLTFVFSSLIFDLNANEILRIFIILLLSFFIF